MSDCTGRDVACDADREGLPGEDDRCARVVQTALAIYLLPAFAVVMVVGGAMILVSGAARVASGTARSLNRAFPTPAPHLRRVKPPLSKGNGRYSDSPTRLQVHATAHGRRGPSV